MKLNKCIVYRATKLETFLSKFLPYHLPLSYFFFNLKILKLLKFVLYLQMKIKYQFKKYNKLKVKIKIGLKIRKAPISH